MSTRVAVQSTHEAAAKIAGIGAVLDGVTTEPEYREAFPHTLLAGAFPLHSAQPPLAEVLFDSGASTAAGIDEATRRALQTVADDFGTRVVVGRRKVGSGNAARLVDVVLVSPHGLRYAKLEAFRASVAARHGFDVLRYEHAYVAIESQSDPSLERIVGYYARLAADARAPYPPPVPPEPALLDSLRRPTYGGVHFAGADERDRRAVFPHIAALDTFSGFDRRNHFLVELEFYFFAAAPLWQATRTWIDRVYQASDVTFFAHDWLGVPLFWAMTIDDAFGRTLQALTTVYFAHEARIARMLVEGIIKDKYAAIRQQCHPDGHDAAFYKYLDQIELAEPPMTLDAAFPRVDRSWGRAFDDIYFHAMNRQAARFDRIVAVGRNVQREMELVVRGERRRPAVALVPNGVPDAAAEGADAARARLAAFSKVRFGFEPDVIVTAVNRCELSKAPWRNLDFFASLVDAPGFVDGTALFIWLSRPKPLPTAEQIAAWSAWGWPLEHRPQSAGGDLRGEEELLWQMIAELNRRGAGRYRMLYVNQFGWGKDKLGSLDPGDTTFADLRRGTDVEVGLAIYEPFGIAPLEPFSSGAVCVLSDASGCAHHLSELHQQGRIADSGFVIGTFTAGDEEPRDVDLRVLRRIEARAYASIVAELRQKLDVPRDQRVQAAQRAMPSLSWRAATHDLMRAVQRSDPANVIRA